MLDLASSPRNPPDFAYGARLTARAEALHESFESWVDRAPDAPAIIDSKATTSFFLLDRHANRLAHELLSCEIRQEEPVGVLVDRSADLPLVFLGILKAGGVYVPLIADLPDQRLANMASQAGIRLLIALDGHAAPPLLKAALEANGDARILDPAQIISSPGSFERPRLSCRTTQLAAILFTSGSTGQPKGVLIQHDACQNMAAGHAWAQGVASSDRILLSSSPGFILGFRELCLPLALGCAWVTTTRFLLERPADLLASMAHRGVTVALFTPSYLRLLDKAVPAGLRMIFTAGERPNPEDARHYAAHLTYWNLHGATEVCGTFAMHRALPSTDAALPSGRPFPNATLLLLDKDGRHVGPGEEGEICVVSPGVSRGYLNEEALSSEYFIDTPWGRAYRTRDLGCWTDSGELNCLGRIGDVVKVSGQSVSLGEIEKVLLSRGGIRSAAVLQHRNRLVAFFEPAHGTDLSDMDWRAFFAARLPAYTVPSVVIRLASMPVGSAGKIDRGALLAAAETDWETRRGTGGEPQGKTEQDIAAIWREVLGLHGEIIGREDNFFRLGGSSLLAIQVGQRLQAAELPASVQDILSHLTIAALAEWLDSRSGPSVSDEGEEADPPATMGQTEFWIAQALGMPAAASHVCRTLRLERFEATIEQWRAAWTALLRHHPALLTHFASDADGVIRMRRVQIDDPSLITPFEICEIIDEEAAAAFVNARCAEPFDLTRAPLARAGLIRLEHKAEPIFWCVMHHAIVDGMSAGQVQRDLLKLLRGETLEPAVDALRLISLSERRYLAGPQAARDHAYWTRLLDDLGSSPGSEALERIPTDAIDQQQAEEVAAEILIRTVDARTARELVILANRHGAGLHALLLTLLAAEVARRTDRTHALIGTGVATRPAGTENQIGHFVNVLPLALPVAPETELAQALRHAQAVLTAAVTHGLFPSGRIYETFRRRYPGLSPAENMGLLDVALTALPAAIVQDAASGGALAAVHLPGRKAIPPAGLTLSFSYETTADGGLALNLVWNPKRIDAQNARAWLDAFARWMEWLAADASHLDRCIPDLLPFEAKWLEEIERGRDVQRPALPFHRLFEQVVDNGPDRAAAITRARRMCFREMDESANAIAEALLAHGLEPGEPVGALADNHQLLPAAMLGVWKAGGVYLPLAADLPQDRISFILADAGARRLVLLPGVGKPVDLPEDVALIHAVEVHGSTTRPDIPVAADANAYLIYTSGTTGRPKGTAVRHDGLVNTLLGLMEQLGPHENGCVALMATPSFDASLLEMGLALLHGLALAPVTHIEREDPWAVKDLFAELGVTIAFQVPSYLRLSQDRPFPPSLRVLLTGGEAPRRQDAARHPGVALWNLYGPAETSILVTAGLIAPDKNPHRAPDAGRPLPNTVVSIRRPDGRRVPPGCTGEVWLGGACVGNGYIRDAALTRQVFVETANGRFYRTGDLARWSNGGALEISGRIDHQIKLHGQRVEPAEVESRLLEHPDVLHASVIVDQIGADEKVLRGFLQIAPGANELSQDSWRQFLTRRLPAHMTPATFTIVQSIPILPNGKVDRESLLRAFRSQKRMREDKGESLTPLEEQIALAWSELFAIELPSRGDNFFALGGNSLLAIRMTHRLAQSLQRPVSARDLFAAPTIQGFSERLEAMAPAKQHDQYDGALATEGEREFWTAHIAGLDTRGHIMPLIRRVTGRRPSRDEWRKAWAQIVARHDALRMSFREYADGRLHREILPAAVCAATFEFFEAADQDEALIEIRKHQFEPMDLRVAPLWRAGVVEIGCDGSQLFWMSQHHATGDGRSLGILLDDLRALLNGVKLSETPASPAFVSRCEQSYLESEAAADRLWWRDLLGGLDRAYFDDWVTDMPRERRAIGAHRHTTILSPDDTQRLTSLARQNRTGLHALILSLLAALVHARTGRTKFLFGSAANVAETSDTAAIVHYGVNMLPLAFDMSEGRDLMALLSRTRDGLSAALTHQRYPFARMCHDFWSAHPGLRDPGRFPLFDIAVTENVTPTHRSDGLCFVRPDLTSSTDNLFYERTFHPPGQDMALSYEITPEGALLLDWQMNAALYHAETARFWMQGLAEAVRWLVANPSATAIPALLPTEAALLLRWEQGPVAPRTAQTFVDLFEDLVDRPGQSDRPALLLGAEVLTYEELDRRANAIAHLLIEAGTQADDTVAVLTRRSIRLTETILGIWKAGAVYLPLTADLPEQRLLHMVCDAGASLLIALDGHEPPESLDLPRLDPVVTMVGERPRIRRSPEEPAYILYTSGSTGLPKGVRIRHAAFLNSVLGAAEMLALSPEDRCLGFAAPSFDVSLSDIGVPLAVGASLRPLTDDLLDQPSVVCDIIRCEKITHADLPPTYLRLLDTDCLAGVRTLVTGGEAPLPEDVKRLANGRAYFNAYGVTEAAITSAMGCLSPAQETINCGRPLANGIIEIRDPLTGERAPPGCIGEIWLAGTGLADEYVNRPDLTEKAFILSADGPRYRTGDLGRWSATGNLIVFGRIDQQVKLNGIRIELSEIEAAIARQPGVAQAVAAIAGRPGERRSLHAFVVARDDGQSLPNAAQWRAVLAADLPSYMIPAGVHRIASVPMTASGKVDRDALVTGMEELLTGVAGATPAPGLEQRVADLWESILACGPVSREDNFFALGGHSLLAIGLCQRLGTDLTLHVPAHVLLSFPVLCDFCEQISNLPQTAPGEDKPPSSFMETDLASEGEREFWAAQQAGYDTTAFVLTATVSVAGPVPDDAAWSEAWSALIVRHAALRTTYAMDEDGETLRRNVSTVARGSFEFSEADDLGSALAFAKERQHRPLAMDEGPLWRAGLVRVRHGKPVLWLALHHAIGDGASISILLRDLDVLLAGQSLPALEGDYAQWATRERLYLERATAADDAAWWRDRLGAKEKETFADWPTDRPRPGSRKLQERGSHLLRRKISAQQTRGLRNLARRHRASLHALLITVFALEVRRRTGRQHFVIGTATNTRSSAAEAAMLGYFVNLLPLPVHLSSVEDLGRVAGDIQSLLSQSIAHAHYPFARIVRDFRTDHPDLMDGARFPLFDMAVTENQGASDARSPPTRFARVDTGAAEEKSYQWLRHAPAQDMILAYESEPDGGISISWFVSAALYDRGSAELWIEAIIGQAIELAAGPANARIRPLLQQELKLLQGWERGEQIAPEAADAIALFEQQVCRNPHGPALIAEDRALTYAEVDLQATILARRLNARGLAPGEALGVYTERSVTLPVVLLAIWKAGGCYLPLTHGLPGERLARMAGEAGVRLILALDGLVPPALLRDSRFTLLRPDEIGETHEDAAVPKAAARNPESPACILYTSGSTGMPKGVILSHAGILNLAIGIKHFMRVTPRDRILMLALPSFDLWISDWLCAWATGAALVPVLKNEMEDISLMKDKLRRHGVTMAALTPSYLRMFEQSEFPNLRLLMTVGEAPIAADARFYSERLRYLNGYGPTENTTATSIGEIDLRDDPLPAGRPMPNTFVLILNEKGDRAPPGCIGEIWTGGASVGLGYVNNPEQTQQSFIETKYGRLYRTGDLGRWRSDSQLVVLGRADGQVKLRGQRVELGEVEQAIAKHPAVKQAAAIVVTEDGGSQRLQAFIAPRAEEMPSAEQWRSFLGRILPDYMIPASIVVLDTIPMTASGKIDRQALLAHGAQLSATNHEETGSSLQGMVENAVGEVWTAVLKCRRISRKDHFFELGGDSLRAIAAITRLRRHFTIDINTLYENPVLTDFARHCRPRADSLRERIAAAASHWRSYSETLPSYEAERDQGVAKQLEIYRARNLGFASISLEKRRPYEHVLLTGATGYVGAYLLRELLARPDRRVTVLVRAGNEEQARRRLSSILEHHFGAQAAALMVLEKRLVVACGDLRRPDLGLGEIGFDRLAAEIDGILHSAANVSHIGRLEDFHADNVVATGNVIELAARRALFERGGTADFHLVSTLSVSGRPPQDTFSLFTEDDSAPDVADENYYVRSKQHAENLTQNARERIANACIHRLGNVVFASDGTALQRNLHENAFLRLVGALAQIGMAPDDVHVCLCHVDIVAQGIIALAEAPSLTNLTHHIEHERRDTLADFIAGANGMSGRVEQARFDRFLARMEEVLDVPAIEPAVTIVLEAFGLYRGISPQAASHRLEVCSERTQTFLHRMGVHWPAIPQHGQALAVTAADNLFRKKVNP